MCVCTPVNLCIINYTFYFYDLYSPVASFFLCVCVHVRALVEREREINHEQTVCGTSGSNLGENELGGVFFGL